MPEDKPTDPQGEMPNGTVPKPEMGTTPVATGETPGTTTQPQSTDDVQKQLDDLKIALKKANAEAAQHRHKANELDKLKADQEAATLSTQQKLEKERDKLQSERDQLAQSLKETKIANAVSLQAQKLGFADPSDARLYIDESQLNEDLSNVDDLLKSVLKAKPYLAGKPAQATSGGATNPARSTSNVQQITREFITTMTSEQYNALTPSQKQEVQRVMRERTPFGSRPI